jgi:hypothetical protein
MTVILKNPRAAMAGWLVVGGLIAPVAKADDGHTLANSKAHKLQVIAEGGTAWCQQTVRLRMVLDSESPDSGNTASQIAIMNVLKPAITADCKTATAAELAVMEKGVATGAFKAQADTGWIFFAASSPSAPVAAPTPPRATPLPVSTPVPALPPTVAATDGAAAAHPPLAPVTA